MSAGRLAGGVGLQDKAGPGARTQGRSWGDIPQCPDKFTARVSLAARGTFRDLRTEHPQVAFEDPRAEQKVPRYLSHFPSGWWRCRTMPGHRATCHPFPQLGHGHGTQCPRPRARNNHCPTQPPTQSPGRWGRRGRRGPPLAGPPPIPTPTPHRGRESPSGSSEDG